MNKFIATEFDMKINEGSSWIIYIVNNVEEANAITPVLMTQRKMLKENPEWYYSVQSCEVASDCRVPKVFHNRGYYMVAVEHNNGDWNRPQTYKLYLSE